MASGDMGYLDEAGRLFVVGRDDEMIVSGGENVYPIEVEKTLAAHPAVAEASAIGVDDEQFGQRLAAFVVLQPGVSATPDNSSSTCGTTSPTTRCPARSCSSTSCLAAPPARSCASETQSASPLARGAAEPHRPP